MMRAHILVLNHFGLHGYLYSQCRYFELLMKGLGEHIFSKKNLPIALEMSTYATLISNLALVH